MKSYICLIDTSYIVYYSSFAAWRAYSYRANIPKELMGSDYDPTMDEAFNRFFEKKFKSVLIEAPMKVYPFIDKSKYIFCMDCPRKDIWRTDIYPEYKVNRKAQVASFEFNVSKVFEYAYNYLLPKVCEQFDAIKVQSKSAQGDDVIAVLAQKYVNNGKDIIIVTGDRDMVQLASDKVTVITHDGTIRNPQTQLETILKKKSITSEITANEFLLFKIIVGDSSDDIPNIKEGIGPKRALELVTNKQKLKKLLTEDHIAAQSFARNKKLIAMSEIPVEVRDLILEVTKQQIEAKEQNHDTIV